MSTSYVKGMPVLFWPGIRHNDIPGQLGTIISDGTVEFGGTECVRIRKATGGTDYVQLSHIQTAGRIEGDVCYVQTGRDALSCSQLEGIKDIVIEDRAESLKMARLMKGFRG